MLQQAVSDIAGCHHPNLVGLRLLKALFMTEPWCTPVTAIWCWQAEIAAKLVAKAQRLARLAKADAGARLELQRSVSAAASSFHRDGIHQKSPSRTASVSQPHAAHTSKEHLD